MPRRVNLPPADELFRKTTADTVAEAPDVAPAAPATPVAESSGPSGRVRHSEKMTVYLTSDELMALEQARLKLRAELGQTVDRGRFVRAALDVALRDLGERGTDSEVAQVLSGGGL